jgi:hypothetical protein
MAFVCVSISSLPHTLFAGATHDDLCCAQMHACLFEYLIEHMTFYCTQALKSEFITNVQLDLVSQSKQICVSCTQINKQKTSLQRPSQAPCCC